MRTGALEADCEEVRAWRWRLVVEVEVEVEGVALAAVAVAGRRESVEAGRWVDCLGWISPFAALSLLVKEEIAQPAQPVSFWGVPIRGALVPLVVEGGGRTESGSVVPYFRMRCT